MVFRTRPLSEPFHHFPIRAHPCCERFLTNDVFSRLAEVAFSFGCWWHSEKLHEGGREKEEGVQPQENLPPSNSALKNKAGLN